MGDDGGVVVALCHLYGAQCLGEGTDLVDLYKDRVGATEFDALFKIFYVGHEEVVADELAAVADHVGENLPAFPVVLVHTVFDGVDGVFVNEVAEELGLLFGG